MTEDGFSARTYYWISLISWLALAYAGVSFVTGRLAGLYWDKLILVPDNFRFIGSACLGLVAVATLIWTGSKQVDGRRTIEPQVGALYAALFALLLFFLGDIFDRRFSFLVSSWTRFDLLVLGLLGCVLVVSMRNQSRNIKERGLLTLLIAAVALTVQAYLETSGGRMIFSDDHGSFVYRLQQLRSEFPAIPFYNTDWNTGILAREFFATGILNVFLVSAPLLYLSGLDLQVMADATLYQNSLILLCFLILPPIFAYCAVRILGGSRIASLLGGLGIIGFAASYFEWLLRYGTLGFCFSVILFPLGYSILLRLFSEPAEATFEDNTEGSIENDQSVWAEIPSLSREKRAAIFFIALVVVSLCSMWTLTAIGFFGLVGLALFHPKVFFHRRKILIFGLFTIAFFAINGTWMMTFIRESRVANFVAGSALPGMHRGETAIEATRGLGMFESGARLLVQNAVRVNPAVLTFGLIGIFALPRRFRDPMLASCAILFFASLLNDWKPQLELRRISLFAFALFATFTGVGLEAVSKVLYRATPRVAPVAMVLCLGYMAAGPVNLGGILRNRSDIRISFAPDELGEMSEAIRALPPGGRTFVLGFILHELGSSGWGAQDGGHIAPIAGFSGRELFASHFFHARWSSVDPIPSVYRERGEEGIEEFLDLVNATSVLTHSRKWKAYCEERERYRPVWRKGRFTLWLRNTEATAVQEGSGSVQREGHRRLRVTMVSPRVVIKYRHMERLRVQEVRDAKGELLPTASVSIRPRFAFEEEIGAGKTERIDYIELSVSKPEVLAERALLTVLVGDH